MVLIHFLIGTGHRTDNGPPVPRIRKSSAVGPKRKLHAFLIYDPSMGLDALLIHDPLMDLSPKRVCLEAITTNSMLTCWYPYPSRLGRTPRATSLLAVSVHHVHVFRVIVGSSCTIDGTRHCLLSFVSSFRWYTCILLIAEPLMVHCCSICTLLFAVVSFFVRVRVCMCVALNHYWLLLRICVLRLFLCASVWQTFWTRRCWVDLWSLAPRRRILVFVEPLMVLFSVIRVSWLACNVLSLFLLFFLFLV